MSHNLAFHNLVTLIRNSESLPIELSLYEYPFITSPQLFIPFLFSTIDHVKIELIHKKQSGTDLFIVFINKNSDSITLQCHRKHYTYFSLSYEHHPNIHGINGTLMLLLLEKLPESLTCAFKNYLYQICNLDTSPIGDLKDLDLDDGFKTLNYPSECDLVRTLQMHIKITHAPFPIHLIEDID
jgi:hypothetical protein